MTQCERALLSVFFGLTPGLALSQTEGQIAKFDALGSVVDSVVTEDAAGNIGIGTITPAAKVDVVGGNVNLENSTATAGNILKDGALFLHNFGDSNTFVGQFAGNFTMSGNHNTGVGLQALLRNTSGFRNTGCGRSTLESNTTGSNNTAGGASALANNTTGDNNTASGTGALFSNTTGYWNTASGAGALLSNTTGASNIASGAGALFSNTTGSGNAASGAIALESNTTGYSNTASGFSALHNNITGFGNTAGGADALGNNTTGSRNTALGFLANVSAGNLTNATAIGAGAIVNASNKVRIGNTDVTVIEGQVGLTVGSDVNQKENFQPVDGEEVLGKLRGLRLTSWNFIGHDPKQFRHYGPMAQDFFAAFGHDGLGTIGTDTTITSTDMDGILMVAAQALERRTVKQREEIATLKAENSELKTRLEALERRVK